MEFLETAWKSFRNLKPRRQQWRSGLNVLLGPNGSGKTNLLESFNVLAGWGVFAVAGNRTSSLVTWGEERAFLMGCTAGERELEVEAQMGTRMSLRVAKERATYSELRSLLPSLSFLPRDIDLLDGSPSVRRLFLDKLCALCSPLYARRLSEYKQLVRHRTTLLRQNRVKTDVFRATVFPMSRLGGWIRETRRGAVRLLSEALKNGTTSEIAGLLPFQVEMALELRGTTEGNGSGLESAVADMAAALEANSEREQHAGMVLVGPHRDDLNFFCLERPAALVLSRGQKRRVVVGLILAAGRLVESRLRLKPILLLDDVAAELDAEGRALMGCAFAGTGWQVFATGVEDHFQVPGSALWRVQEGVILEP
ncbi:MAG: DNA replication and repair protein RecF [Synergistaceae bacterium]|nr:DNA replication and repair protein RecF [Synergistaceae bacterium]